MTPAYQAGDPGSNPGVGESEFFIANRFGGAVANRTKNSQFATPCTNVVYNKYMSTAAMYIIQY